MIEIRPATTDDINFIMELERLGFHPSINETKSTMIERLNTFADGFLIMTDQSIPIGYISSELWPAHTQSLSSFINSFKLDHSIQNVHDNKNTKLYISSMTIHPDHRSKSLGRKLFNACIERIVQSYHIESIILLVNENWTTARLIYQKENFQEIGIIPSFFIPGESGIIMRKELCLA